MPHHTPLISTIVAALVLAAILGALALRLRVSPLVGYLLAGVIIGPFTPGYVADQDLATQLAEIGVILLMFGVGLHFSLKDLLLVRFIAVPGAIGQIVCATVLGWGVALWLGWSVAGGLVFGLALSVASTVVLLRALQERRLLQTDRGKIAIGWLIVEDLAMVFALVLLPPVGVILNAAAETANGGASAGIDYAGLGLALVVTLAKVAVFIALMLLVGRRLIPSVIHYIAWTGSRELFRLGVLAIALGVAYGAALLFDVSFALGAFFAGMMLAESELSHRAAEESLPLRDAFAVLFFVSVGMLFDPFVMLREPLPMLATLAIIVVGKSVAAFAIVRMFGHPPGTALLIAASLGQIGEFSFILAALGVDLGFFDNAARDLIVGGAVLSILVNPVLFWLAAQFAEPPAVADAAAPAPEVPAAAEPREATALTGHVVLVGYGRVGRAIAEELRRAGRSLIVIDDDPKRIDAALEAGEAINGNAATAEILTAANIAAARELVLAIPNGLDASVVIANAKKLNPGVHAVARAHWDIEAEQLHEYGADAIVMSEQATAHAMVLRLARDPV